nr:hypothetical protein 10 [Gammaproteobacteria bacterium]
MPMKTWMLEKAPILNDGIQGQWEVSLVAGKPEIWHDYQRAVDSADDRNLKELDGCYWRVADDRW